MQASGVELTAAEVETLRRRGLERRDGVPGLYLLRSDEGNVIPPPDHFGGVKLDEGELKVKAERLRDELVARLTEKGTEWLPKTKDGKADLMGVWLVGANLASVQLQHANLIWAQLQMADLARAQLQGVLALGLCLQKAHLWRAQLQKANLWMAQLQEATLEGAQLQNANLEQAQLGGADLTKANLAGANFASTDLDKANLKGAIELMPKHKPPRAPATSARGAWRAKAVASAAGKALYAQLAQEEGEEEEDDDDDGSESESDGEGDAEETPWQEQVGKAVEQAVTALVAVAQPVLALVEPMIAELARLVDKLSRGIPLVLVRLARRDPAAVAQHLRTLLSECVVAPIFDVVLPKMATAVGTQLQAVVRWVGDESAPLDIAAARATLLADLQSAHQAMVAEQQRRFGELLSEAGGVDEPAKELVDASLLPAPAAPAEREGAGGGEASGGEASGGEEPTPALDEQLRAFAAEVLSGLIDSLIKPLEDPKEIPARLKTSAQARLDAFVDDAAAPIADALAKRCKLRVDDAAAKVPRLLGFLDGLKDELCKEGLRKSFSKQLMGCLPTRGLGDGTAQLLSVAGKLEASLSTALDKLGDKAGVLKRHLAPGGIRGRACDAVLKAATKYNVRVGSYEGSIDMLRMAWSRGRVDLTKDELQIEHLLAKLTVLEAQEATANNWRDTADTWIAVLRLRGQLRVEAATAVLDCMCGDDTVLRALGAAEFLMDTKGEAPTALVTAIAKGPGAHIRSHGYKYTKRLNKEVVLIRRVKELQMRAVAGVGTLLVAAAVTIGQYFGTAIYDGVNHGFDQQSWLTWVLPVAVVAGLLALGLLVLGIYWCWKKRGSPRRSSRSAQVAPLD